MKNNLTRANLFLISLCTLTLASPNLFGAFATQFIGPDGGNWNDPGNWSSGVPIASNEISLGGFSVVVTDTQVYKDFDTSAGGGSITVQNGGFLTTDGGFHGAWGLSSIVIQNGGVFNNDPATEGGTAQLRSTTTVDAGGTLIGFSTIRSTLNINGLWQAHNSATANVIGVTGGGVNLNAGGVLELDIFGTGSNENFAISSGRTVNIDAVSSTLRLTPQGAYTPTVNDTFDFFGGDGTFNVIGDASNIEVLGYNGVVWDTTNWETDGVLTIAAVPEPGNLVLFAFGTLLLRFLLKKRR